ncbi:tail fiber protein [Mucilaginibacter jinjuensis]|uniref:Tail fiber protein n=1 Tax=Mucilaginibacter jinjuensis TaxID=1176721 RepID=A0ABY7TAV8_9SPHI|nr:tail fiber protein [Mucilaginibacter jinjuensis]WCT13640.1 tail fiber protein [Mucilaginibacter jinjuensis]
MKKLLSVIVPLLACSLSYAQNTFPWPQTGSVGIGTTTFPTNGRLLVNGPIDNISVNEYGAFRVYDGQNFAGGVGSYAWAKRGGAATDFTLFTPNNLYLFSGGNEQIAVLASGKVGIGTNIPDQKLTVNGTIHATEVLVDQTVPTPDYVFDQDYELSSLKDVKSYIDKNHHLPEIPSAAQVAKDGINLGEMNARLLKKIEELTLYLIEKDKKDDRQQQQINRLENQVKKLLATANKNQ